MRYHIDIDIKVRVCMCIYMYVCVHYICATVLRGNAVQSFATIKQLSQDDNNTDNEQQYFCGHFRKKETEKDNRI